MSGPEVPIARLEVAEEDVEAVLGCLRSGWLTMGPRTEAFEAALGSVLGGEHVVAVSSGTAALHLACRAAGVGPGDEVIVPAFSLVASAHAAAHCGAEVVFADSLSPLDPNLAAQEVRSLIGPATKAIVAAHRWGYPCATAELREACDEHGVLLIEDCSEAIGASAGDLPVGSVGHLACFSFCSKQLSVGEGGALTSDDPELAAQARSLRSHAMTSVTWERHRGHGLGYDVTGIGFNYRIDEPRAALGLSRIGRLADEISGRRRLARLYRERLASIDGISLPFADDPVDSASHGAFPLLAESPAARDRIRRELLRGGVETAWSPAVDALSAYASAGRPPLPVAAELADRHLTLPIYAGLGEERAELVIERLAAAAAAARS